MINKSCVYPGSFDPLTFGHLDIIKRSSELFDKVTVAVLQNTSKQYMFTLEQRLEMLTQETKGNKNITISSFDGLLVDFLSKVDSKIIVRGVRNGSDLEMEEQMANTNRILKPGIETILFMARPDTDHIRSSIIKELIRLGADISRFVPKTVVDIVNRGK